MSVKEYPVVHGKGLDVSCSREVYCRPKVWDNVNFLMVYHTYLRTYNLPTESLTFLLINVGRSIKTHLYWAMKNCGEAPDKSCALIMNIADHYQVCFIIISVYTLDREGCND